MPIHSIIAFLARLLTLKHIRYIFLPNSRITMLNLPPIGFYLPPTSHGADHLFRIHSRLGRFPGSLPTPYIRRSHKERTVPNFLNLCWCKKHYFMVCIYWLI